MPKLARDLSPEEVALIRRYIEYDHGQRVLRWRARVPADFGTKEPERTARGWNRAFADQVIDPRASGQLSLSVGGVKHVFSRSKVLEVFVGAKPRGRAPSLGARPRSYDVTDAALLRRLMHTDADGVICWSERSEEVVKALRVYVGGVVARGGFRAPAFDWDYCRRFNRRFAGRPVELRGGRVRLAGVLTVPGIAIRQVFPNGGVVDSSSDIPDEVAPVSDAALSATFGLNDAGMPTYRVRDKAAWEMLVAEGCAASVPNADKITAWNLRYAGKAAGRAAFKSVSVGRRTVGIARLIQVLNANHSYSF